MISIITRCRNRLEYTTQVINAVKNNSHSDHEHIIIDNASSDGTHEWFTWMQLNTNWFNLKYIRYSLNLGDWGGMVAGLKYISNKSKYVVQLDNDIIPCDRWLEYMTYVLEHTKYRVVMLKRANVQWVLNPLESKEMLLNGLEIAKVERPVACFMASTEDFRMFAEKVKRAERSKYEIRQLVKTQVAKIMNHTCIEIEAPFQRKKYNPKNKQIWEKL